MYKQSRLATFFGFACGEMTVVETVKENLPTLHKQSRGVKFEPDRSCRKKKDTLFSVSFFFNQIRPFGRDNSIFDG